MVVTNASTSNIESKAMPILRLFTGYSQLKKPVYITKSIAGYIYLNCQWQAFTVVIFWPTIMPGSAMTEVAYFDLGDGNTEVWYGLAVLHSVQHSPVLARPVALIDAGFSYFKRCGAGSSL